tara:strand:+ start:113 stop:595 length:483 start_codon:yes stop_codon:yes gene_type:complete
MSDTRWVGQVRLHSGTTIEVDFYGGCNRQDADIQALAMTGGESVMYLETRSPNAKSIREKEPGMSFGDGAGLVIFFIVAIVGVVFLPYVLSSYLGFQGASVVYKSEKNNKTKSGIKKKKKNALILALILGTIGFAGGKWIRNEIDPSLTPGNFIEEVLKN